VLARLMDHEEYEKFITSLKSKSLEMVVVAFDTSFVPRLFPGFTV